MNGGTSEYSMVSKFMSVAAAAGFALVMFAAPAQAATHSGNKACSTTFLPRLYLDSRVAGNGTWSNNGGGGSSSFTFPAGASQRNSPYQNTHWWVYASQSFYYTPYATCVK